MATAAEISATLESALMKLRYEESAGRKELEQTLFGLKVVDLKSLCKELRVKVGNATKGELVRRLLSQWQMELFVDAEDSDLAGPSALTPEVQQQLADLPPFESVHIWTKDLSGLKDFTSKDKEFDHTSLRSFKSLKAHSYFSDGLVRNMWLSPVLDTKCIYAITRMLWCDFVVWTEGGLFIERISFDEELWKSVMLPKLIDCLLHQACST